MRAFFRTAAIAISALAAPLAVSQEYPARTVRVVVPFAPGGGTDIVARLLSQHLTQRLGQSFVVENRPAGSGIVGADYVAKASPDGYTLLFAFSSLASSARLVSKLPYDPVADFAPITLATTSPLLLIVPASLPAKDVKEFTAYAKANPGKLNYGSSGPGSSPHLATELLMSLTGVKLTHIPYKGIAPAVTALLADEVQFSIVPIAVAMPHVKSGKLRALGSGGPQRSAATPDIPTVAESGLTEFEAIGWWGVLAPARTPRAVVNLLNKEIRAVLDIPEVKRSLIEQGMDPAGGTPEQFAELIKHDMQKWGDIGIRLGVKLD
jgi:tripartite-type tricarboxylate transporter receptor subunit TctC